MESITGTNEAPRAMKKNDSLTQQLRQRHPLASFVGDATAILLLLALFSFSCLSLQAAQLKQARVTQVVRDVKLLPGQAAPRPAAISDQVREGTAVRTGLESRAELTFTDATLARLGANTIFSFDQGTRNLQLGGGAMLLRVPKNAGGAQINTAAITAAITGTTMLIEFHPDAYCKFIMLEGVARIFRNNRVGESVLLRPGQMLIVNPKGTGLPEPVDVDLERLMETSLLITGFGPLPSLDLIARAISEQAAKKNEGVLNDTGYFVFKDVLFDATDPTNVDRTSTSIDSQPPTPPPTPTEEPPSKVGPPTTIASSTLYVINSGTVIQTDPTITTNGVTDFGTNYRGPDIDGPFSIFAFGSTSDFDTTSGFDAQIDSSGSVFKFTALQLTGDPTISTTGGETNLALIGVNGITSGGPGGVLTFAGLNGLLLATVDGSITLGSEISFESLNDLTFYARGAASSLTLGCDITTLNELNLYSEGGTSLSGAVSTGDFFSFSNGDFNFTGSLLDAQTISITSGGSVNLSGAISVADFFSSSDGDFNLSGGSLDAQTVSIISGQDVNLTTGGALVFNTADFLIDSAGDINSDSSLEVTQANPTAEELLTTTVLAGGDINIGGSLTLVNDNSNGGDLTAGANIVLTAGGDINVGSDLILNVLNNTGGHIGIGGNILVSAGGDLTAGSIDALINNRDAGTTDNGGILSFDIGGNLTTSSDAAFVISARNDGAGGGTFGSAVSLTLNAASISVGGFLDFAISANAGGLIPNALLSVSAPGSLFAGAGYTSLIQSTGFNVPGGPFIEGGTISGDALLLLDFGSVTSGDYFDVEIDNFGLGTIGGEALLSVAVAGDLNAAGDIFTDIINTADNRNEVLTPGGTIGGDATVSVFSGGDIIAGGVGEFAVLNNDLNFLSEAGSITGNASVFVDAVNITTGGFFQPLVNNTNGSIGGDASVQVDVTDDISVGAETFFNILNSNGDIGGFALADLFATNFTSGSTFQFQILNDNGSIGSDASLFAGVSGALTINSDATIQIGNASGSIAGDATIDFNLGSFSANSLLLQIDNLGGFIGGESSINFTTDGDFTAGSVSVLLNNRDGGSIGAGGNIFFSSSALTTSGDFSLVISNRDDGGGGGTIGSESLISLDLNSCSVGGLLTVGMSLSAPGSLGAALSVVNVEGDLVAEGGIDLDTQNGGLNINEVTTNGGSIDTDVLLSLAAGSVTSGDFLSALLVNLNGGSIGGGAAIDLGVSGDITVATDALWQIINTSAFGLPGSTIGSDASLVVTANNLSAGSLFSQISNTAGSQIAGNAILTFATTGAIASVGDATFRIVNFDNGVGNGGGNIGGDATINLIAQSLSAANLITRINNLGGTIGGDATINLSLGGALTTTGNATIEILQDLLLGPEQTTQNSFLTLNAASLTIGGSLTVRITDLETSFDFDNVTVGVTDDITVSGSLLVEGSVTAGGNVSAVNGITVGGGSLTAGGDITSTAGSVQQDFGASQAGNITAGGDIFGAGGLFTFGEPTVVTAGGSITAPGIIAGALVAGTDITVDNSAGSFAFGLIANSTTASGTLFMINSPTISPDNASSDGIIGLTPHDFDLTVASIVSTGPTFPLLFSNGFDADPNVANNNPGNGGNVTLDITDGGLTIGSVNDLTGIDANGGMFAADSTAGGSGGTVNITATGDVTLLDGNIRATTGIVPDSNTILGDGGTVNITTAGAISVNSTIEVSSDDVESDPARFSSSGGNISLTSTTGGDGPAITVSDSGQLLALLDPDAPGLGGSITLLANGNGGSSVNVNGFAEADRGTIDIRHTGTNGMINLSDAIGTNSVLLFADVVKVGALGSNGVLTVGNGFLSANDTLKLYATGSNGIIDFVANVTLNSENRIIIAANTVTIEDDVVVTVTGNQGKGDVIAEVFTNVPNYSEEFGGNDSTTGTFAENGATTDSLDNAPPFDDGDGSGKGAIASPPTSTTNSSSPGDRAGGADAALPRVKRRLPIARVTDSNELLALMDKVTSGPTESGRGGSKPATGKTLPGKGRILAPAGNVARPDLIRSRDWAHRPAALP